MAKRWKKQKAGTQKGARRKKGGQTGSGNTESASGMMGGFRRGLRVMAGSGSKKKGPKSPLEKAFDVILWIAVIVALGYFMSKQCL